ncbi:MAG: dehydrogenase [Planctomycetota bacterium]|nr:MAG: dehydrogenase [Planctomycetota bacterium]
MFRLVSVWVLLGFVLVAIVGDRSRLPAAPEVSIPDGYKEVQLNGHKFKLPLGFDITLCASSDVVPRPISAAFDDQGRLYVSDSSGSNEKSDVQLQKKPHRILRLEDKDADGKFESVTVFAENMMFPEGTMWLHGSLYVAAPPSIWKLTDKDGDGIAEDRVEWFQGKTLTGCANDLHGPYSGPDGFIYWCKGAFAKQEYKRSGSFPLTTNASHIFRSKPDGSSFEHVMTGGMDNPVDVTFTSSGERIFTTTFFQNPANGLRDGLIHAVYGGIYGKVHGVLNNHPWTSPEVMPVLSHLGAAAPCGLHAYESHAFGKDYKDNLFSCSFNMRKITRHQLEYQGAGLGSKDSDFLVSDQIDFHPTDVIEDSDGSLLVIDTGGWYKLCCPTSQLVKPDVRGAIYRIRKTDAVTVSDPFGIKVDFKKATVNKLAQLLSDDRFVVRKKAADALVLKGDSAIEEILKVNNPEAKIDTRIASVWALCKLGTPSALLALKVSLNDPSQKVRLAALNALSLYRSNSHKNELYSLLKNSTPPEQRLAAEIAGRTKDKQAIPLILSVAEKTIDRVLSHAFTYALYEIQDFDSVVEGLASKSPNVRKVCLHALEMGKPEKLKVEWLLEDLNSPDKLLRDSAWWIVSRHGEWGNSLAPHLQTALDKTNENDPAMLELFNRLGNLSQHSPLIATMLSDLVSKETTRFAIRKMALRTMASSGVKDPPESWVNSISNALGSKDKEIVLESLKTLKLLKLNPAKFALVGNSIGMLAVDGKNESDLRLLAFSLIPTGFKISDDDFEPLFLKNLITDKPVSTRISTAETLAKAKLSSAQLVSLLKVLEKASPAELDRLLDVYAGLTDENIGKGLLAAIRKSPSIGSIRVETIKQKLVKLGPDVQKEIDQLQVDIRAQVSKQYEKLEAILPLISTGDIRKGQSVFQNAKAACIVCHAIGYLGGKVGPDLTKIGQIRSERDLLEAILFPSASFVRSYEPIKIATSSGKVFQGVIKSESPEDIVLITGPDQQTRILRADIEIMEPGSVSVMPAGLDQQFTPQELADLVAFLKASR